MQLKAVRNGVLSFQTVPNMFEVEDLGNPDSVSEGSNLDKQYEQRHPHKRHLHKWLQSGAEVSDIGEAQLKMEHMAQVPGIHIHPILQLLKVQYNSKFISSAAQVQLLGHREKNIANGDVGESVHVSASQRLEGRFACLQEME